MRETQIGESKNTDVLGMVFEKDEKLS